MTPLILRRGSRAACAPLLSLARYQLQPSGSCGRWAWEVWSVVTSPDTAVPRPQPAAACRERGCCQIVNIQAVTAPAPGLLLSLINYISFSVTFSHAHFSLVRPHFPRVLHTETPPPLPSTQGIIDIDHYPQPQQINCQPVQLFCLHKVETIVLKHILKQMSDDEQMLCVYKMWKVIKRSG